MQPRKHLLATCSVLLIAALLVACSGRVEEPGPAAEVSPSAVTASVGASAEGAAAKGLTCLADAYNGNMNGAKVSMTGPFTGSDAAKFNHSVKPFEDATGIDIAYQGSNEFETVIATQMQTGTASDIVDFPQPGLLGDFFSQGKVIPVTQLVPEAWLRENYQQSWLDIATLPDAEGTPSMAGVWHRFNGKSLVWYPKETFDERGYTVPTTWQGMLALQDQIVADGDTPWCIGIESGSATGWPATDWTEEMMLRTTTPENYDKWVKGELPFSSPEVKKAIETFAGIWNTDDMVFGSPAEIVTTYFGSAFAPMFQKPPRCWLHHQGNFITTFFPDRAQAGVDYDVFYFPPVDPQYGKPFLVGGDIIAATTDRPEVCAVMQYFSTGEGIKGWLAAGGALGPQNDVQPDWYGNPLERKIAAMATEATTIRFDGSDLMPGRVGSGSFWKGMTDYFSGAVDLDTILKQIDDSWPKSTPTVEGEIELETGEITSQALAGNLLGDPTTRKFYVMLPPSYAMDDRHYPVVYVLHGYTNDERYLVGAFKDSYEKALAEGAVQEMIFVFPDASNKLGGSYYLSSATIGDYETYISQEFVEHIDATYRTLPDRTSRGITGCSMGGDGSMYLALKYPDVFSVAAPAGGRYDYQRDGTWEYAKTVVTRLPEDFQDFQNAPFVLQALMAEAAGAAPDPAKPPFYLEMPVDMVDGQPQVADDVVDQVAAIDAVHELERYLAQPERLNSILIYHSTGDEMVSVELARDFDRLLTDHGVDHEYLEVSGRHCYYETHAYVPVVKFMSDHLVGEE